MERVKKGIIIVIMIIAVTISYNSKYNVLMEELKNLGHAKQSEVNDNILLSTSFIENITLYADDFFSLGTEKDSKYIKDVNNNEESKAFNLDSIKGTNLEKSLGNLTGVGNIPRDGEKRLEINLALELNDYFNSFYNKLSDIAWIYYTSEKDFLFIYPWVSSEEFAYSSNLKTSEYYEHINPENNPKREKAWSHPYMDHAGKGLMVTLSSPIYFEDTFKGVVSLDLTNSNLSKILSSNYKTYLFDDLGSIIASNDPSIIKDITKLSDALNFDDNQMKEILSIKDDSIKKVEGYYIYCGEFNDAPWKMVMLVPAYKIVGESFLFTVPIILMSILLMIALQEAEFRKKTEQLLKKVVITDQLTETNNRHCFDVKVLEYIAASERFGQPISMVVFDLDYFKKINDAFGHPVGDEVLKQTVKIATNTLRKSDMLFRIGGEEFAVLLPDTDLCGAIAVAEKLRSAIEQNEHKVAGKFTASFGVGERLKGETFNAWYKKADQALYEAKNQGRNRVVSFKG